MNLLILSTVIRIVALIIFIFGIIPIMIKEAFVKDYLRILRLMIPIMTFFYLFISVIVVYVNLCRINFCISDGGISEFSLFNSIASLVIAIIMLLIYHRKY